MAKTITIDNIRVKRVEVIMAIGSDMHFNDQDLPGDENVSVIHYDLIDADGNTLKECNSWMNMGALSADSVKICDDYVAAMLANMIRKEKL